MTHLIFDCSDEKAAYLLECSRLYDAVYKRTIDKVVDEIDNLSNQKLYSHPSLTGTEYIAKEAVMKILKGE